MLPLLTEDEIARCCPQPSTDDEDYGFGALRTPQGNLPLKLMDVQVKVTGLLAQTHLRQTYVNTLGVPLEATYIFPLPDRAAVSAFTLVVSERTVEGVLKERGAARREYQQAIDTGHRAAIAEEERPGVFTLRVGNVLPGEEASVQLVLDGPVHYADGEATYRFPLVVAPRYIPGGARGGPAAGSGVANDTDAVPDASRITPPVLLPGFPNPVRLTLAVELDPAGLPLGAVRSSLHAVRTQVHEGTQRIELRPGERLNRDFVLHYALAAEARGSSLTFHPDPSATGEGTFHLTLVPPASHAKVATPRDVVFLLDRSGSMGGWKMVAARRATARMIDTLTDHDRFSVLGFDHAIAEPPRLSGLVPATDRNRYRAVEWLGKLEAAGGTELAQPLHRSLQYLQGDETRDRIVVLVTDGQVGNEDQILRTLAPHLAGLRVFTLGIDRAVNAGFLRRLAGLSGGFCELVESEDRLDEVMDQVHRRIGTPLLTDLRLEGVGLELVPGSMVPARLPDLFAGAPLRILGRYRGTPGKLTVRAFDAAGSEVIEQLAGVACSSSVAHKVWARGRVRDLEDRYVTTSDRSLAGEITALSLRHGVLCRFTSFVAVDRAEVANQTGHVHKVTQAVEQPDGWGVDVDELELGPITLGAVGGMPASAPLGSFAAPAGAGGGDPFGAPSADPFMGGRGARMDLPVSMVQEESACAPPPPPMKSARRRSRDASSGMTGSMSSRSGGMPPRVSRPAPSFMPAPQSGAPRPPKQEAASSGFNLLAAYQRRGQDLLKLLDQARDAASDLRQRELGKLVVLLTTLIEDLASVGGDPAAVAELERLRDALRGAQRGALAPAELDALERQARQTLQRFVDRAQGTPVPPAPAQPREGFWF
ncbi:MAG: VWA domain-containing protein [Planctomycetes bacterium]|nr:VWA domain-containing protein [Planctomycetota bacterium]